MVTSNSYRRGKSSVQSEPVSRWKMTYGSIAAKLLRKGNIRVENAFALAKFLGSFVYLYSFPYEAVKKAQLKMKVRRKLRKREQAELE